MKIGVYLNTAGGGVDYHKQTWVKAFAEGVNTLNPEHSATLIEQHEPVAEYEYSFCFSYQGEMFKKTKKLIFPQLLIGEITIVGWLPPEQEYKILDLLKENKIDFEQ